MRATALVTLLALALTTPAVRADVRLPPPPPPPPPPAQGEVVAQVVAGSALGFAVAGFGVWLARRRARPAVAA
ncbi:hypothetical protein J0H58_12840 [bacterium]|nr:hypothetical protein [bacterium]